MTTEVKSCADCGHPDYVHGEDGGCLYFRCFCTTYIAPKEPTA
jgi:hypothetical protein